MRIDDMMKKFKRKPLAKGSKIEFLGCAGYDVYNITAPFEFEGMTMMAGRVDKRDSEESDIVFFKRLDHNQYEKIPNQETLGLQDPFFTKVEGRFVVGGVQPILKGEIIVNWKTNVYYMNSLNDFDFIFSGPTGMKDIRLKELTTGEILVLTRPQGGINKRGRIGAVLVKRLEDINDKIIEDAPLLKNNFEAGEWGGANEIYELENGEIAVLGHIARFEKDTNYRDYYALAFKINLETFEIYDEQIIAERSQFEGEESKRIDLYNVVFSGGFAFINQELVYLYVGMGDVNGQCVLIKNPFGQIPRSETIV